MGAAVSAGVGLLGSVVGAGAQEQTAADKAAITGAQMQETANETTVSANVELGQADASKYNAAIAGDQATLALQTSAEEMRAYQVQAAQSLGTTRVSYAASGIGLSGSALDVLSSSAQNAELNALTIKHEGDIQAWTYGNQENLDLFQAANASYQATAAQANAAFQESMIAPTEQAIQEGGDSAALGTLLSGTAKAAGALPSSFFGSSTPSAGPSTVGGVLATGEGASMNFALGGFTG